MTITITIRRKTRAPRAETRGMTNPGSMSAGVGLDVDGDVGDAVAVAVGAGVVVVLIAEK